MRVSIGATRLPRRTGQISQKHNLATFYMSNIAPQSAFLNRRIWADLESYSRDLVRDEGRKLQVYAATILRDGREGIGRNGDILIPLAFYKVVVVYKDDDEKKTLGYTTVIMPNVTSHGRDPVSHKDEACQEPQRGGSGSISADWRDYKVSLREIEKKAGMAFPNLENTRQL